MQVMPGGAYVIEDEIDIPGEGASFFVFCAGWLLEIVEIESGEFYFFRDGEEVRAKRQQFAVFYPAFSIIRAFSRDMRGRNRGIGALNDLPELPRNPILFETDFDGTFTNARQSVEIIDSGRNHESIEFCTKPSLLTVKAKKLIDENYAEMRSIARIAARLKVSHEHLSRQFKRDYQMTPSGYLRQLRIADATFRLAIGEKIIDISQDVGYNDLSRFYKQFHKTTRTSPADCRAILRSGRAQN